MALDIFIPDIHGDPEALRRTLIEAKLAHMHSRELVFDDPGLHELIFTGDYIDRGPANLETLELLVAVREHFKSVILEAGNHDIVALQALTHPSEPQWMRQWMEGVPLLREVALRDHLTLRSPTKDAHPLAHTELPDNTETERYFVAWRQFIEERPEMQHIDFPVAFERTRELFLDDEKSPFRLLFEQMKFAHRIGDILAVHAGINEKGLALGVERLNALYRYAWARRDFRFLFDYDWQARQPVHGAPLGPLVCMMKPLPPSENPLISKETADRMYTERIPVMVHGHAVLLGKGIEEPGVQQCNDAYGKIADMNGDIGMSSGFLKRDPNKPSDWGFIQYDETSGQFTAVNPKTGPLDFGTLLDGQYTFPRRGRKEIDFPHRIS